jgi:hypothetical protein
MRVQRKTPVLKGKKAHISESAFFAQSFKKQGQRSFGCPASNCSMFSPTERASASTIAI